MKIFIFFALISFVFAGCENSVTENEPVDYSIDQRLSCFCPNSDKNVRLYIRADSIADAVDISKKIHLPKDEWGRYKTIKGLFDEISLLDSSVFTVEVSYDPIYQFPSLINAYPKPIHVNDSIVQIIMDAGFSYSTSNYVKY
jgi:Family of unknown function (DUF6174)